MRGGHLATVLARRPVESNTYIRTLQSGCMPASRIRKSQTSFVHAINAWPQLLAKLLSRLTCPADRILLLKNVNDEHGHGRLEKCHVNTFLAGLDVTLEEAESSPAVDDFVRELEEFLTTRSVGECAAALGMVEYTYGLMSTTLKQQPALEPHYALHEEADDDHAEDLFTILSHQECEDSAILEALTFGHDRIMDVFEGLLDVQDHNISFSNVMEDSREELRALLPQCAPGTARGCMVGSGGCSVMSALSDRIDYIDVVDSNSEQIHLIMLKLEAVAVLDEEEYLGFLQGTLKVSRIRDVVEKLPAGSKDYWSMQGRLDWLAEGCIRMGKFEQVFSRMSSSSHGRERITSKKSLARLFGADAVAHTDHSFADILFPGPAKSDYFEGLMARDCQLGTSRPPYMDNFANIRRNRHRLRFHCADMADHLRAVADGAYDFIAASNLTDWMPEQTALQFIELTRRKLRVGGRSSHRRLGGRFEIGRRIPCARSFVDESRLYADCLIFEKTVRHVWNDFVTHRASIEDLDDETDAKHAFGDDYFRIRRGSDGFAFYQRRGLLEYPFVLEGDKAVAACAMVRRKDGEGRGIWYVGDLKVSPTRRRCGLARKLVQEYVSRPGERFFAIEMIGDENATGSSVCIRLARTTDAVRHIRLHLYTLSSSVARGIIPEVEKLRGSRLRFVDLTGIKDLVMESSQRPMRMLHACPANSVTTSDKHHDSPQEGYVHMLCCIDGDDVHRHLQGAGLHTNIAAWLVTNDMSDTFAWLSTADL